MLRRLGTNRVLWLLLAVLSLAAGLSGFLNPGIYSRVVSTNVMPGVLSQDLCTIIAAVTLVLLTIRLKEGDVKKQIVILGLVSYLFYGYGIYTIERVYNALYLLYMALFGAAFYTIVYGLANLRPDILQGVSIPKVLRYVAVGFLLFVPLLFSMLWISQLVPLMQTGRKIEFTYSIYILDLCFVMPAFVIVAIMTAKNVGFGLLLAPALFIKGFTVLFPVGLAEYFKPRYHTAVDVGGVTFYLGFAAIFLVMTLVYVWKMRVARNEPATQG